jgi:hypothetical protein
MRWPDGESPQKDEHPAGAFVALQPVAAGALVALLHEFGRVYTERTACLCSSS